MAKRRKRKDENVFEGLWSYCVTVTLLLTLVNKESTTVVGFLEKSVLKAACVLILQLPALTENNSMK